MKNALSEKLSALTEYHRLYILNNEPLPEEHSEINPDVLASWKRCKKYGLDPTRQVAYKLTEQELQQTLDHNRDFLNIAEPYIKNIYNFVKESNFVIHLSDNSGCLLKYYSDDEQIRNLFQHTARLDVGSIRYEAISGTDSPSLCAMLDKPIQVVGAEHYFKYAHRFFCSSAPIHDTSGRLIGILTVMGPVESYQEHTLGMVCATANGIELMLQKANYFNKLNLSNELLNQSLEALPSGIVILGHDLNIIQHNRRFLSIFHLPDADYTDHAIYDIFVPDAFPDHLRSFSKTISNVSLTLRTISGRAVSVVMQVRKFMTSASDQTLTMLFFEEERQMHRLINTFHTPAPVFTFDSIIGNSPAITAAKALGKNAARSNSNVLILGESGTGKELMAQAIHNFSDRRSMPFVVVNCGALPKNLIESELFGYEGGSFTGANKNGRPGKFELADGGTIFLDEIGSMPLELQTSLLRVLQSSEVTRIGGNNAKYVDVRIIAATNVDLLNEVNNNTFRLDLFYRLNVLNIIMPALRDRKEDIPPLTSTFIKTYAAALGKSPCTISTDALHQLSLYDWPGNVRQLENVIERAVNLISDSVITTAELSPEITVDSTLYGRGPDISPAGKASLDLSAPISPEYRERKEIIKLLKKEHGHIKSVAYHLDMPLSTLYKKLKRYELDPKHFRNWSIM